MIYKERSQVRPVLSVDDWGKPLTEPDQTLSIKQILERVSKGLTTGIVTRELLPYDDDKDDDFDDPTMDPDFNEMDARNYAEESGDIVRQGLDEAREARKRKKEESQDPSKQDPPKQDPPKQDPPQKDPPQ